MIPNKEYWMGRALTREQEAYLRGTLLNKRMFNEYQKAADKLKKSMATMDARTCEVCGALDGKHFPIKDATPGVNFPPMHPNDRCTTVEYDPDDAADWAASGEKMPESMTYQKDSSDGKIPISHLFLELRDGVEPADR